MTQTKALFRDQFLSTYLADRITEIPQKVNALPRDAFMHAAVEEVVEHVASQARVEPLRLHEQEARHTQNEVVIDLGTRAPIGLRGGVGVPGTEVVVIIPYDGHRRLWNLQPNRYGSTFPHGRVDQNASGTGGSISICAWRSSGQANDVLRSAIASQLDELRLYMAWSRQQVEQHNEQCRPNALIAVNARRRRLKEDEGIEELLGIPLRLRDDAPLLTPILLPRRLAQPLPPAPQSGYRPEPGITDEQYERVLAVIRHEGRAFEAAPATFALHGEEGLRDILVAHINGHYEGGATGETFRRSGKTDILVAEDDRAAFVAECKVWRGPQQLADAADQLLSYLTWRDCKTALIVFNKHNAGFSEVQAALPEALCKHPRHRQALPTDHAGEWRFVMASLGDEGRHVRVHVFLFDLHAPGRTARGGKGAQR